MENAYPIVRLVVVSAGSLDVFVLMAMMCMATYEPAGI
jgi:hypothetical protein